MTHGDTAKRPTPDEFVAAVLLLLLLLLQQEDEPSLQGDRMALQLEAEAAVVEGPGEHLQGLGSLCMAHAKQGRDGPLGVSDI